ncbi:Non-classical arabinogalactan protein 30 [Bienertia sinuspersici]
MSFTTTNKSLSHTLLLLSLAIICCSHLSSGSAVQPHTYSPAPAPSPSHHHHSHHHGHHAMPPSPAHSPSSPPSPTVKPPAHSPVNPPPHSPVEPPAMAPGPYAKPPTKAPSPHTMPPRKLVAVEGVVYCKNCSYSGVDTLMGASPLPGATVELRCKNTKYMIKKASTTDKNGFFFLQAPKHITTYGAHKCLVFLVEKPNNKTSGPCTHATNLNGGVSGAFLFFDKHRAPPSKPLPFSVYSVGPFAFEPPKCYKH